MWDYSAKGNLDFGISFRLHCITFLYLTISTLPLLPCILHSKTRAVLFPTQPWVGGSKFRIPLRGTYGYVVRVGREEGMDPTQPSDTVVCPWSQCCHRVSPVYAGCSQRWRQRWWYDDDDDNDDDDVILQGSVFFQHCQQALLIRLAKRILWREHTCITRCAAAGERTCHQPSRGTTSSQ